MMYMKKLICMACIFAFVLTALGGCGKQKAVTKQDEIADAWQSEFGQGVIWHENFEAYLEEDQKTDAALLGTYDGYDIIVIYAPFYTAIGTGGYSVGDYFFSVPSGKVELYAHRNGELIALAQGYQQGQFSDAFIGKIHADWPY